MTTPPARPTYPLSEPELNALYLRLAAAFRRLEARRTARAVSAERLPLPVGEGQGEGGGSRRGPYRRRTALDSETGRGEDRAARPVGVTAPGHV